MELGELVLWSGVWQGWMRWGCSETIWMAAPLLHSQSRLRPTRAHCGSRLEQKLPVLPTSLLRVQGSRRVGSW